MAVAAPRVPPAQARETQAVARHPWLSVLRTAVRTPRGAVGLGLALLVVLVAIIGPFVAPHSPDALMTLTFAKPSGNLPLGSDFLGRAAQSPLVQDVDGVEPGAGNRRGQRGELQGAADLRGGAAGHGSPLLGPFAYSHSVSLQVYAV